MKIVFVFSAFMYLHGLSNSSILPEGSFILTSPKVIDAGSTVYFTLTVFDVPQGGTATVLVLSENEEEIFAESSVIVISNHSMWVEMTIPPMSSDIPAKLRVQGSFSNGYKIQTTKEVIIRHNTILTFVQTDKPLYKPGQTIRFRVLPMDNQLKPLDTDTIGDVWIEDPLKIRVSQWKDVKFTEGIKQFELPLSEEPTLGIWTIRTEINKVLSSQSFKVEKYVLPKFEVTIKPPSVIMADADTINIEICAKYTYGKKVEGTLKAEIRYYVSYQSSWTPSTIPSVEYFGQISGCYEFVVNTDDLLLQTVEFGYRPLKIYAEVTENGTEIVRNATADIKVTHDPLLLEFVRNSEYYKQKLPYYGYLQVLKPDGSPVASEKIQICAQFKRDGRFQERCRIFSSDKTGMIRFSIAPTTATKILLEATAINYEKVTYSDSSWRAKLDVPRAQLELRPWFSPSNSYLQIASTTDEFLCDRLQQVKVRYTAKQGTTIKFYHQVLSKGRIVQQGSHQRTFYSKEEEEIEYDLSEESNLYDRRMNLTEQEIGEFILSFNTRATMSPKARLLIFYVREDKEIVADSRMFLIKKCLINKVSLHFRHEQQYPSTEAAMLLSASPSSICGISMVDKSIRLLEKDTTFNKDKIFKVMEGYDIGKTDIPLQTNSNFCPVPYGYFREYDMRSLTTYDDIGPLTRYDDNYWPGRYDYWSRRINAIDYYVDAIMAFEEAGMVVITDLKINTRPCIQPPVEEPVFLMRADNDVDHRGRPGLSAYEPRASKSNIYAAVEDLPKSTEEIRSYFPETWLWELISVGSSGEVAIKRQIPDTITEWTGGAICVHPKTGLGISDSSSLTAFQPFFIDFQLPYSVIRGEILTLTVSVFNYLSECLPIKFSLEPSEEYKLLSNARYVKVCVCGGQSVSKRFLIRPVMLGQVNITVYGFSIADDDEVCGNELTARLSARDAITKQLLVEAEGFPKEEVFNYFICPENTNGSYATEVDLLLPEDVISGSARAYMTVTGDIIGPALNGLKNLVRLPYGCGEQNMVLFAPNIFVMDYLSATGKLTETIKQECLNNMKTGYQRELKYRHKDGSYSAFGSKDSEGSLWLTAFVLKSFGQARKFINIDEEDLSLSTSWIRMLQFENGCFRPSGSLFNQEMKGGLKDSDQTLAPLTAYILISLLESGAEKHDSLVIKNGLKCLEAEANPTNYALSLFAYASSLAKEIPVASKYMRQLNQRAVIKGNQMYWKSASSSKSVSIETAGYYILGNLEIVSSHDLANIIPVVRWLTQQRNSYGGFISTQDTVVALQSLAKYASMSSKETLDMGLAIESDELIHGFRIDEDNKLVTQSVKIPVLPAVVDLQAVGEGCALIQFSLRYNVENVLASEIFDLNVEARRLGSSNCNLPRLSICMRYKVHEKTSNMVVLSVKMVSGFLPDKWSLLKLENYPEVQLKRHDIKGNEVNLYFEQLTNDQKCFEFFMKSEFEIEDAKPSIIKLYDYYQPEFEVTKEYSIPSVCNITALPQLPWLPPLIPDFENLDDINILDSTALPLEEENNNSLSAWTTKPTADDDGIKETKFFSDEWPTELLPTQIENDSMNVLELSDAANVQGQSTLENSTHLSRFVDVDQDLNFPDGLEENWPVSILPPNEFTTENTEIEDCPVCRDYLPDNITEIYCNSAFALKVVIRDVNLKVVKVLQDVSFYIDKPKSIRKFGNLEVKESCLCTQLNEQGKTLLIIGSPLNLWNSEAKKHKIHLQSSVHVLLLQSKTMQSFLSEARNSCEGDP